MLRVSSVALSVLSMLSSTKEKKKPTNDEDICSLGWKTPKDATWVHNYADI